MQRNFRNALLLIALTFPMTSFAQQIYGQVRVGPSGAPAAGGDVTADCGNAAPKSTRIDASGRFRLSGLPRNSRCELSIVYRGSNSSVLAVPLSGPSVRVNLELSPWTSNRWLMQQR